MSKLPDVESFAKKATIHNEFPGYNCQDYVIELLEALEEAGITDRDDQDYKARKAVLLSKYGEVKV